MYKIRQVAHMLGVSTVDIHSQLIEQREALQSFIHKNTGVTFIDAEGVKVLARLLEARIAANAVEESLDSSSLSEHESTAVEKEPARSPLFEDESLDEEMKIFQLRERISRLKAQINKIDQDILLKDEAIEHYLQELNLQ